jgi:regulator of protease activity HflC (stomatin/prohibitin superfamily)
VVEAMHQQVSAERQKRATILASEALQTEQINIATGQAKAVTLAADAQAEAISTVAHAIAQTGGADAVSLRVAERYVDAFKALAKEVRNVLYRICVSC